MASLQHDPGKSALFQKQSLVLTHIVCSMEKLLILAARMDRAGMMFLRFALVVVLFWIGGLKFASYEADSIVPFVANSPLMSFFYAHRAPEYRAYMNKEGELNIDHRRWHESNGTYRFSCGLGSAIIFIGLLIALHPIFPRASAVGSLLLIFMSLTTVSFLFTTPEAWVPPLGDTAHGFPFLAGPGRLVVKDLIMLGAAFVTMADSAATYRQRQEQIT